MPILSRGLNSRIGWGRIGPLGMGRSAVTPPIDWDWQQFDLTAGTDGVQWVGYSDGGATRPQPAFGSISGEPTPRTSLLALYEDTATGVFLAVFAGDFTARLAGIQISFGGFVMDAFEIELIDGNTWARFSGIPGDLTPGAVYEVEFGFNLQASPIITEQPSITPASGRAGTRFVFDVGAAEGRPVPVASGTLTFNGAPVALDPEGGYTPILPGSLVWSVEWSNGIAPDASAQATVEVEVAFTPAELFEGGQAGFWPGSYDPAGARLWQEAAGTTPATLPGDPVGKSDSEAGTVDASQAVALSRPTLARWPKGGRRNLLIYTEDLTHSAWVKTSSGAGSVPVIVGSVDPPPGYTGQSTRVTLAVPPDAVIGDRSRLYQNIITNAEAYFGGWFAKAATPEDVGRKLILRGASGGAYLDITLTADWVRYGRSEVSSGGVRPLELENRGTYSNAPVVTVDLFAPQFETGPVATPYQRVTNANDITEPGVPDVWHLFNDGGDSLNASALPAGPYGLSFTDEVGAVTVQSVTSDGATPISVLRANRQADVILRQGAFTLAEEAEIRAYWGGLYA